MSRTSVATVVALSAVKSIRTASPEKVIVPAQAADAILAFLAA
jgi:hypothetical protein